MVLELEVAFNEIVFEMTGLDQLPARMREVRVHHKYKIQLR